MTAPDHVSPPLRVAVIVPVWVPSTWVSAAANTSISCGVAQLSVVKTRSSVAVAAAPDPARRSSSPPVATRWTVTVLSGARARTTGYAVDVPPVPDTVGSMTWTPWTGGVTTTPTASLSRTRTDVLATWTPL